MHLQNNILIKFLWSIWSLKLKRSGPACGQRRLLIDSKSLAKWRATWSSEIYPCHFEFCLRHFEFCLRNLILWLLLGNGSRMWATIKAPTVG